MSSAALPQGIPEGACPERREPRIGWFDRLGPRALGIVARRARAQVRRWERLVRSVNDYGPSAARLDEREILQMAEELQLRLRREGFRDDLVARSFALVREMATRTLGERHFDVQLIGGGRLVSGVVAAGGTGGGKTLTGGRAARAGGAAGRSGRTLR